MKARHWFVAQICLLCVLAGIALVNAQSSHRSRGHNTLEGAWRLTSYRYRDAASTDIPREQQTHLKYYTSNGRFVWVNYDPKTRDVQSVAGGRYSLDGSTLRETPEFTTAGSLADIRVKEQVFTINREG